MVTRRARLIPVRLRHTVLVHALLGSLGCAFWTHETGPSDIKIGGTETCVVESSGGASCWGMRQTGPERVESPEPLRSLEPGVFEACGRSQRGTLVCTPAWAGVAEAQPCPTITCLTPHVSAVGMSLATVSGGYYHACALTTDGRAWCVGHNTMGQLGNAQRVIAPGSGGPFITTPQRVVGDLRFSSISAGEMHTCGVTDDGEAWCWGYGQSGEIGRDTVMTYCGNPPRHNAPCSVDVPVRVETTLRFRSVVAGMRVTCGITRDDAAYCWGSNPRCGLGFCGPDSHRPTRISLPGKVRQVAPGYWFSCAVVVDDRAFCWGDNVYGQLGSLATAGPTSCFLGGRCTPVPTEVSGNHRWRSVSAGALHACGVTVRREVYCWGSRADGRLAHAGGLEVCENRSQQWKDQPCSSTPVRIPLESSRRRAGVGR